MIPIAICYSVIKLFILIVKQSLVSAFSKSEGRFKGKVAVVTGSSRGIGRSIAEQLCKEGARVMLNGKTAEHVEHSHDQFRNRGFQVAACVADVGKEEDCKRLIQETLDEFGRIDILINNAGVGCRGFVEETLPDVFWKLLSTNVMGSIYPTLSALPHIIHQKGSILFISSLAGLRGLPNRSPYSMSKMMLTALSESLRTELYSRDVHIGIVYVGSTAHDPGKKIIQRDGSSHLLEAAPRLIMDSQQKVARTVLEAITSRRFKTMIGFKGVVFAFLVKYMPWLVERLLRKGLVRIRKYDK